MQPAISLCVISYNKLAYLRATLLALHLLECPPGGFEVVVVDDGSSDGTEGFLRAFEPGYPLRWARQANAGRAAARNVATGMAQGQLLVILDDDGLFRPESLLRLWEAHQQAPDALLISSLQHIGVTHVPALIETIVRDGQVPWQDLRDFAPIDEEYALADLIRRMVRSGLDQFAVPWLAAQGTAVSMPRHLFERLGGYDERFTGYGMEDFDLGFRAFDAGLPLRYVPGSQLYHMDHGHNRTQLFKESAVTTRALFEKFAEREEIRQFVRFLCGATTFKAFNNAAAAALGMAPIEGINLRFSPYGMIRYREQQLSQQEPQEPIAIEYSKAQEFRLQFLLDRIGRDIEPELAPAGSALPALELPAGKSVLVIAPHMDDEVIGCGGLLARLAREHCSVSVVFLTDGASRNMPDSQYQRMCRDRRIESERAADLLGVDRCLYLGIPERQLESAAADPAPLVRVLDEIAPDLVLVPSEHEHHPDHRVACRWLRGALQGRACQPQLLLYEVWGSCRPNVIHPLDSEGWRQKRRALDMYRTQLETLDYRRLMNFLVEARARCLPHDQASRSRAEAYRRIHFEELLT